MSSVVTSSSLPSSSHRPFARTAPSFSGQLSFSHLVIQSVNQFMRFVCLLFSSPGNDSFWKDLCFTADVFFIYSTRDLLDASADQREILHDNQ